MAHLPASMGISYTFNNLSVDTMTQHEHTDPFKNAIVAEFQHVLQRDRLPEKWNDLTLYEKFTGGHMMNAAVISLVNAALPEASTQLSIGVSPEFVLNSCGHYGDGTWCHLRLVGLLLDERPWYAADAVRRYERDNPEVMIDPRLRPELDGLRFCLSISWHDALHTAVHTHSPSS